ncbi:MAG: TetR/AcrR family transcriptional regulator [Rhizomicrobium sp.]
MPRILTEADIADFRERLCRLATRLLVERGPENFNMRLLASEMGVSAMTPYRYFKDKNEILSAIRARALVRFASQLERALAAPGTLAEQNTALGNAYIRFALEEQVSYRLIFDFAEPGARPQPELKRAEERLRAAVTEHVRKMVDAGYFEGDPERVGQVFWAGLHGLAALHLAGKLKGDPHTLLGEMNRILGAACRVKIPA